MILVSLSSRLPRLHVLTEKLANPGAPLRFAAFLRAHIRGGRIESAEQLRSPTDPAQGERIVRVAVRRAERRRCCGSGCGERRRTPSSPTSPARSWTPSTEGRRGARSRAGSSIRVPRAAGRRRRSRGQCGGRRRMRGSTVRRFGTRFRTASAAARVRSARSPGDGNLQREAGDPVLGDGRPRGPRARRCPGGSRARDEREQAPGEPGKASRTVVDVRGHRAIPRARGPAEEQPSPRQQGRSLDPGGGLLPRRRRGGNRAAAGSHAGAERGGLLRSATTRPAWAAARWRRRSRTSRPPSPVSAPSAPPSRRTPTRSPWSARQRARRRRESRCTRRTCPASCLSPLPSASSSAARRRRTTICSAGRCGETTGGFTRETGPVPMSS